jgi:hypothetical protein
MLLVFRSVAYIQRNVKLDHNDLLYCDIISYAVNTDIAL